MCNKCLTWEESLQAATEREEEKWALIIPDLVPGDLLNWALLRLFDSVYASPVSTSGRKVFGLLLVEIRARLDLGRLDQFDIESWGIEMVNVVRDGVVVDV